MAELRKVVAVEMALAVLKLLRLGNCIGGGFRGTFDPAGGT